MSDSLHVLVLTAGKGSRMKSNLAKVLHPLGHAPLVYHVLAAARALCPATLTCVTGHDADRVEQALETWAPDVRTVRQGLQTGTGAAVRDGLSLLPPDGHLLVLFGDSPLITPDTLAAMHATARSGAQCVVLGFRPSDPGRYGRLVERNGLLEAIVEDADATPEQRRGAQCNGGAMLLDISAAHRHLPRILPSPGTGEIYLTDIVRLLRAEGGDMRVHSCPEKETLGVNTQRELAYAEAVFQARRRDEFLDAGVRMPAPETVHFAHDTRIDAGAIIEPYVVFGPGVMVAAGAHIRPFCHIEGASLDTGAVIGPYARLRPHTRLDARARAGNFVEIKNARIGPESKVNHLSYIGDAEIGAHANIGAGTVTCNYDGVSKHHTRIGQRAFVGSGTMLVAPVEVGAGALTAAGSTITRSVPDDALAIARSRQTTLAGRARALFDRLRRGRA